MCIAIPNYLCAFSKGAIQNAPIVSKFTSNTKAMANSSDCGTIAHQTSCRRNGRHRQTTVADWGRTKMIPMEALCLFGCRFLCGFLFGLRLFAIEFIRVSKIEGREDPVREKIEMVVQKTFVTRVPE